MGEQTTAAGGSPKRAWVYLSAAAIALSIFALAIVAGNIVAGVAAGGDENAWAHLFQLAMAAQLPLLLLFVVTADWNQRRRAFTLLAAQIIGACCALAALAWSGY